MSVNEEIRKKLVETCQRRLRLEQDMEADLNIAMGEAVGKIRSKIEAEQLPKIKKLKEEETQLRMEYAKSVFADNHAKEEFAELALKVYEAMVVNRASAKRIGGKWVACDAFGQIPNLIGHDDPWTAILEGQKERRENE